MLGAIIGDIVGSVYEWNNIKTKDFPLFREDCFFTDDTVSPNRWVCEFASETFLIFIRFKVDYKKKEVLSWEYSMILSTKKNAKMKKK